MEVQQLLSILTACIVHFLLIPGEARAETVYKADLITVNDGGVREKFQHLFDSVAKNDIHRGHAFRDTLKVEVAQEQQDFDTVKEDLRIAQNRRNLHSKRNMDESIIIAKRETHENKGEPGKCEANTPKTPKYNFTKKPYIFPEIHGGDALQPTLDLLLSQEVCRKEMERIYLIMMEKNPTAEYISYISAMLNNTKLMLGVDIGSLQEYLTTGAPDAETKRWPWLGVSSNSVFNSWKRLKEFSLKMVNRGFDEEIEGIAQVADLAMSELTHYSKYADEMLKILEATPPPEDSVYSSEEEDD